MPSAVAFKIDYRKIYHSQSFHSHNHDSGKQWTSPMRDVIARIYDALCLHHGYCTDLCLFSRYCVGICRLSRYCVDICPPSRYYVDMCPLSLYCVDLYPLSSSVTTKRTDFAGS